MSFDFASTERWETSVDTILPAGNYVATITEAQDGTSSGGYPQIELRFEDDEGQGAIRDWLAITEGTFGKVKALAEATGVIPNDTEAQHFADNNGRAAKTWLRKLIGKKLGIIVRDEADYKDPTKTRQRVQGYVEVDRVKGRTGPAAPSETTPGNQAVLPPNGGQQKADVDIPF